LINYKNNGQDALYNYILIPPPISQYYISLNFYKLAFQLNGDK